MSLAPKRTSSVLLMAPTISQALPLSSAVFPPSGKHLIDRYTEFVEKSQERQSKAEQEMMTTVNNNTLALQRLCDKLGKEL